MYSRLYEDDLHISTDVKNMLIITTCVPMTLASLPCCLPALYCAEHRCFSMHAGALGVMFHWFSLSMVVSTSLVIQITHLTFST